jgi:uncharacterized protein YbjT (DUF2867 family)
MKTKVLVTGATGNVGAETIKCLLNKHAGAVEVRAAVQDIGKARRNLLLPGLQFTRFNFEDLSSVKAALDGVDKLFLLRPPQLSDVNKYIKPVILAAKSAGVKHIVFLSLQGVEHNRVTPHYKIEQIIRRESIPYTFLRPSFFMQNLSTTHRNEITERSEIFIPAGEGKTSFVDARDLGEVAALALSNDGHLNQSYELTGPTPYDYYEIAGMLSRVLGRPIRYTNPSVLIFFWRKWREGTPVPFIFVMIALYTVAKLGKAAGHSTELQEMLGREPTSFEQFAEDYKDVWA